MDRFEAADLYVVITEAYCGGRPAIEVLDEVLAAGVRLVQLREKDLSDREYFRRACAFREHTLNAGALLVVDDRVDIALAVDADGVHLGLEDLPLETARQMAPALILGASCHSVDEVVEAQRCGASYVNVGPIFDTQTKQVSTGAVGPELIDAVRPHLRVPFTVMGGIKAHNIDQVLSRGARLTAVVTAVTAAPDVRAAAAELRGLILKGRGKPRAAARA